MITASRFKAASHTDHASPLYVNLIMLICHPELCLFKTTATCWIVCTKNSLRQVYMQAGHQLLTKTSRSKSGFFINTDNLIGVFPHGLVTCDCWSNGACVWNQGLSFYYTRIMHLTLDISLCNTLPAEIIQAANRHTVVSSTHVKKQYSYYYLCCSHVAFLWHPLEMKSELMQQTNTVSHTLFCTFAPQRAKVGDCWEIWH